jgi:uncharacterized membrane protein YidH (DUF202 family)
MPQLTILEQVDEATSLARKSFAVGDLVGGIAAVQLAAQLLQLARISQKVAPHSHGSTGR